MNVGEESCSSVACELRHWVSNSRSLRGPAVSPGASWAEAEP